EARLGVRARILPRDWPVRAARGAASEGRAVAEEQKIRRVDRAVIDELAVHRELGLERRPGGGAEVGVPLLDAAVLRPAVRAAQRPRLLDPPCPVVAATDESDLAVAAEGVEGLQALFQG